MAELPEVTRLEGLLEYYSQRRRVQTMSPQAKSLTDKLDLQQNAGSL